MDPLPNPLPRETWPERRIREALEAQSYEITEELRASLGAVAEAARDNVTASEAISSAIETSSADVRWSIGELEERVAGSAGIIEGSISELGHGLVAAVSAGTDQVSAEVGRVGSLIAMHSAVSIALQLVAGALLLDIARSIRSPRATAAAELVRQARALRRADPNAFSEEARQCLEQAISEDPTSFLARLMLADLLFHLDRSEDGDAFIEKALLLATNDTERSAALRLHAISMRARGDYASALGAASRLVELEGSADAVYLEGQLLALTGETIPALEKIRKAIGIDGRMFAVAAMDP